MDFPVIFIISPARSASVASLIPSASYTAGTTPLVARVITVPIRPTVENIPSIRSPVMYC